MLTVIAGCSDLKLGDFHELMDLVGALFFSSPATGNYVVSQSVMIKLGFVFAAVMVLFALGLSIVSIFLWKFYSDTGLIEQESQKKEESFRTILERQKATSERVCSVVLQVSHDIRSPLSVLSLVIPTLSGLPEEKREIVLRAAKKINDMANKLLQTGQTALKEVQALESQGPEPNKPDF